MDKQVQIFDSPKFGAVRTVNINGEIHFVASDIAKALGYKNPSKAINDHCRWVTKRYIGVQTGIKVDGSPAIQQIEVNMISKGDIYRLAANSELPRAEEFESWIFDDVIPTIDKHGVYMTPAKIEEVLSDPDTIIKLATTLKEERQRRLIAEAKVEKDKPKVLFADSVTAASTSILVGDLAKLIRQNDIDIGEIRLWKWMRDNGYAIKEKGHSYNMPTQKSMDLKVMEVKEGTRINSQGESKITRTTLITGKGQIYFVNKFLEAAAKEVV